MSVAVLLLVAAACVSAGGPSAAPEAVVSSGRISGKWTESRQRRAIAAFEGIPYAAPPVGELRFRTPQPAEQWSSVLQTIKPGPICTQRDTRILTKGIVGEEDCLYINVYTPEGVTHEEPVDVLFYIHGGGWMWGSGAEHQPDYLLDHDVILVTHNYRLGPLGFISTQDDVFPGNNGLKDQVHALRWVQENIRSFGGNPDSVTIFGESAGGFSVHLQTLSPLAKGLFHRAIAMSGTALTELTLYAPGQAQRHAARLAEVVKCPSSPSEALRKCLLTKSSAEITAAQQTFLEWGVFPAIPFKVAVEASGPEAFIDRPPIDMIQSGDFNHVPLVTGVTAHEGCLFAVGLHENDTILQEFDERFRFILPLILLRSHLPKAVLDDAVKQIRKFYYGEGPITQESKGNTIDLMSDVWFVWPALRTVQLHVKHGISPVYFYEFAHPSNRSFSQLIGAKSANYGVCHADDVHSIFPMAGCFPGSKPSDDDVTMSKKHVELFVNFAKTGRPGASWQSVAHPQAAEYLHIGPTIEMRADYVPERMQFWTDLYPRIERYPSAHDEL